MPASTARRSTASKTRAARPAPIVASDLQHYIIPSDPQVSPDGSRILFTRKHGGDKNAVVSTLWLVDTDGEGDAFSFTTGKKDSHGRWSPDGETVAFIRAPEKGRPQLHLIPADGGEARVLTDFPEGVISEFRWSPCGTWIAVSYREQDPDWTKAAAKHREEHGLSEPPRVLDDWWYRLDGDGYFNAQRFTLHLVNVKTGRRAEVYTKDNLGDFTFDFSPDGKKIAISTNRDRKAMIRADKTEILILDVRSRKLKAVPGLPEGPKTSVRWSPDGRFLAYAGREGTDGTYSTENLELWVCDPVRGRARNLTGREDYCLMAISIGDTADAIFGANLTWSADSKRIYFKIGHHGEAHLASIKRSGGSIEFHTRGAADHDFGPTSAKGRVIGMIRFNATSLPEIHVGDLSASSVKPRRLTNFNRDFFKTHAVASITSHWVSTADGTKVQTWVMMPPGHNKNSRKKYPGVLEIHGGPHGQYSVGYFHEFQVLAAQGYVVVFSNPRGSKGYGRDHCHAIHGHWGTADWVDIQAVTEFMKTHPNIDARRMGIMGGSYGGYMTNWAIGHTNDFAGAITDRCVSNVVTMGGTSDYVDAPDQYFPGNFWDRPEARWEQSPIRHVGKVKTPTLIIHSEGDLRCNIEQAEQVFVALKLRNVPTRFVRYPRSTSHGLSRGGPPDLRIHRLEQILGWWSTYLAKR